MSYLPYSGIGARKAPYLIRSLMIGVAGELEERGFVLRSGGAYGSDAAFENGLKDPSKAEIFLPEQGFNGHASERFDVSEEAFELARRFCSKTKWHKLNDFGRQCYARSGYQVLGRDLESPSKFVVCWTPRGADVGGTAQAIRIARAHNIPVFNLFDRGARARLPKLVQEVLSA